MTLWAFDYSLYGFHRVSGEYSATSHFRISTHRAQEVPASPADVDIFRKCSCVHERTQIQEVNIPWNIRTANQAIWHSRTTGSVIVAATNLCPTLEWPRQLLLAANFPQKLLGGFLLTFPLRPFPLHIFTCPRTALSIPTTIGASNITTAHPQTRTLSSQCSRSWSRGN
jgi:hypothetical protein